MFWCFGTIVTAAIHIHAPCPRGIECEIWCIVGHILPYTASCSSKSHRGITAVQAAYLLVLRVLKYIGSRLRESAAFHRCSQVSSWPHSSHVVGVSDHLALISLFERCPSPCKYHPCFGRSIFSNKICLVNLRLRGVRVLRPVRAPISLTTTSSQAEMSEVFIFPHASRVRLKIKLLKTKSPSAWTVHPSMRIWLHRVDAGPHFVFFGRASMRITYPTVS